MIQNALLIVAAASGLIFSFVAGAKSKDDGIDLAIFFAVVAAISVAPVLLAASQ